MKDAVDLYSPVSATGRSPIPYETMKFAQKVAAWNAVCWQRLSNSLKRRKRLAVFGKQTLYDLEIAKIDVKLNCDLENTICGFISNFVLKKINNYQDSKFFSSSLFETRGVCSALNLNQFQDPDDFQNAVRRANSYPLRSMRKAKRAGYLTSEIDENDFQNEIFEIRSSKLFRTGGLSTYAVQKFFSRSGTRLGHGTAIPKFGCPVHWTRCWGVFLPAENTEQVDENSGQPDPQNRAQLVGWCKLRRAGNMVIVLDFMGHGEHLSAGIMDLLFFNVFEWLIKREDSTAKGIEFVVYGVIEHSSSGLAKWKVRRHFLPYLVELS